MTFGVKARCDACGGDSWTGPRCTACLVQGAPDTRFWWGGVDRGHGWSPRPPEVVHEAVDLEGPSMVCPTGPAGACGHEAPTVVVGLVGTARGCGWLVEVGHSRGRVMGGTGKQLAAAEMWSVRFRRPGWQGYAVRRGAAWSSVCVAGETLPPFLALGTGELAEWLADPSACGPWWYQAIVDRKAGQKLAAKVLACPGRGRCAWVDGEHGMHTHRGNGEIRPATSKAVEHGG